MTGKKMNTDNWDAFFISCLFSIHQIAFVWCVCFLLFRYQISQEEAHLPTLFKTIKKAKAEIGFEAFSVSQTSLEQVFIKFADGAM